MLREGGRTEFQSGSAPHRSTRNGEQDAYILRHSGERGSRDFGMELSVPACRAHEMIEANSFTLLVSMRREGVAPDCKDHSPQTNGDLRI
jgi:hypothetical protein